MARYEITSWLIGDSVPCRLTLEVNGTPTNADNTPTVSVWDSTGTKQVADQVLTNESTGSYAYYAPSTDYPVGKCFYVISYTFNSIAMVKQSMFFTYDQTAWMTIERIRGTLDNLQEGEVDSSVIYQHYLDATRWISKEASSGADPELVVDCTITLSALWTYVSYLADRERAGQQGGAGLYLMVGELRAKYERALISIQRYTVGPGEVFKGVFRPTTSAMQYDEAGKRLDRANQVISSE